MIRLIIDYEKQTLSEIHMKIVRPRWMVCFDCSWLTFLNMLVYFLLCTYICINNIEWIINVPFLLYYTVSPLCTLVRANSPWLHSVITKFHWSSSAFSISNCLRTAQKMKFSVTDFCSKYEQMCKNCGFILIYWKNSQEKTLSLVRWQEGKMVAEH